VNVLVVKPSSLGDVVHTFPAVHLIRDHNPDATITWVVNHAYAEMVELCKDVDDVAVFQRKRWGTPVHWGEFFRFARELRNRKYDLVVDFQGLFRSGILSYLARAPRRAGFAHAREGATAFYNEKVLVPANVRHAIERNLFLAASTLGVAMPERPCPNPVLEVSHDGEKQASILLRMHRLDETPRRIAVAPAARWQSKRFPAGFFAKALDRVATERPDVGVWLLGTADEKPVGEAVVDECHTCRPEIMMGEANLVTLIELLRKSDVLLTNDSGPMHLAAAIGTPAVALFGPTDPELTGPYGVGHTVLQGRCEDGPCLSRHCRRKDTQHCSSYTVSPEDAAKAMLEKLHRVDP
jgi:lipopolysaccharide heptosyltransferase I